MSSSSSDINDRPSLAYVVHSLNLGGAEQLAVKMSRALSDEYRVFILCLDEPGLWADQLREEGIVVKSLWRQQGFDLNVASRIASFCRQNQCRIIHAHQFTPWHYSVLSKLFYSQPKIILEEHGRHYPEVDSFKRKWFNRIVGQPLTRRMVAVSRDIKDRMLKYEGLSSERIELIYNGCNPPELLTAAQRQQLQQGFGLQTDDFVVGSVGRFDPIKNLPLLVKGIKQAQKRGCNIKGLLVGDGPVMPDIQRLIQELGLDKDIVLTGYRADAGKLVQLMDLFVLPSFSEGTSMALLEAMAAAVPCLVTDVGGNPEIVRKDLSGWVIPSDQQEMMTNALLVAASDTDKCCVFGAAGRKRFIEYFSFDAMLRSYRKIYRELLETSAGGRQ